MSRARRMASSPVFHFALSGLLALALVAVVGIGLVRSSAHTEALRDAKNLTRLAGRGIVEPNLTPAAVAGRPAALAALDHVIRSRVLVDPVVRVKIWTPEGRIIYSDEPRLIGERYPLETNEQGVIHHDGIAAEVSDLSNPENRFEQRFDRLREVYLGIAAPGGGRLLFEEYLRDASISGESRRIWSTFIPILLGALLLLELTQLPLAASLTRRLGVAQADREGLLHAAVDASEAERRRIARDLHDGVVQELAGVSYSLSAAAQLTSSDPPATRRALEAAGDQIRQSMRQLRTLLVDLYPDSLHRQGLEGAITDLLAQAQTHAITASLQVTGDVTPSPAAEAIIYRTTQEALRNVISHAAAQNVAVTLGPQNGSWVLEVRDDGHGFAADDSGGPHFGLRMLGDLAREHGGDLNVRSSPGVGATITLTLPRAR